MRRIVTGAGADGRSLVVIDGGAANMVAADEAGLAEIWMAALDPARLLDCEDRLANGDVALEPGKGAIKIRWFTVPVEDKNASRENLEAQAAFAFAAVNAAHCRVDTTRHPMMHTTDTLDFIILVKGEVDLLLDKDEVKSLKPGDVVVQRATNHAWINRGAETALLVAILMNAG
ncbi:MAG: cupin domain-containing protein [Parvularculaceae bacterium]